MTKDSAQSIAEEVRGFKTTEISLVLVLMNLRDSACRF